MMGGPKFKGNWYARPRAPGLSAQNNIPERGKYTAYKWTSKQQDNTLVYTVKQSYKSTYSTVVTLKDLTENNRHRPTAEV
jgi:hypothetical protein